MALSEKAILCQVKSAGVTQAVIHDPVCGILMPATQNRSTMKSHVATVNRMSATTPRSPRHGTPPVYHGRDKRSTS
jgi:hypothetical protein